MIKDTLRQIEQKMNDVIENLRHEFVVIRTGKATPSLLEGVKVSYYGTPTPINHVATLTVPEAGLIMVKPWDKSMTNEVKNAILKSNLGLVPTLDGDIIKIPIPPLSDERRQELIKVVHRIAEEARVSIRNRRREAKEEIERMEKEGEVSEDEARRGLKELEELTSKFIEKIDGHLEKKEKEIREI
ncbi:MAG TPA: ribosome recycling factor [Candidatus Omnitrophica bacterium]|nr:ribosome recycling factor [Candidatus Omnitrophota bacterium]